MGIFTVCVEPADFMYQVLVFLKLLYKFLFPRYTHVLVSGASFNAAGLLQLPARPRQRFGQASPSGLSAPSAAPRAGGRRTRGHAVA